MVYRVDASWSRFIAQAFAKGLLSAFGHNPRLAVSDFEGEAEFDADAPHAASVRMMARSGSLVVIDDLSEKDRREIERMAREEILDAAFYPEIVYRSSSVTARRVADDKYQVKIIGELTLRGVTRERAIEAMATIEGNELRARGVFMLRPSDFKLPRVSVASGLLKLKDEVQLSFDILAHVLRD